MRVLTLILKVVCLSLCLTIGPVSAQPLPLPEPLISLNSDRGSRLLLESEANRAYWPLSIQFVTQKNQAYCGVASLAMVLNALGVSAPSTPEFEPFKTFTQDNRIHPSGAAGFWVPRVVTSVHGDR
ncbi:phytochelatin synthase family protein [Microvirga tunisiensis]|uniref:glutathione gamma-glutamylcysteinyltransferase n=1 Tax=Microvirga tunisiensis TaxID=2108360 RepID=A0A5N7MXC1_9HYPH|nr:phytochelatin synthase family protein [Microvirga tunisiensis]MPR13767.1 hypothetical protein [Microvirga tunisiensis]MPR31601.1 hypothetical protein [Microvirga tunisiensis]